MIEFRLRVIDSDYRPVDGARLEVLGQDGLAVRTDPTGTGEWRGRAESAPMRMVARADGYAPETLTLPSRAGFLDVLVGLRKPGQLAYRRGDHRLAFTPIEDAFLIHARGLNAAELVSRVASERNVACRSALSDSQAHRDSALVRVDGGQETAEALAASLVAAGLAADVARIIQHGDRAPLGLTGELVVRFRDDVTRADAEALAAKHGMRIARSIRHAGNAFLLVGSAAPSYALLAAADALADEAATVYAEPNLLVTGTRDAYVPNDKLWPQVPHLPLIGADNAWDALAAVAPNLRGGSPDITIAILDDLGVAPDHPELTANLTDGSGKLVVDWNFAVSPPRAQTVPGLAGNHGTQCAGSATAAFDDNRGLPGVAPNCHLIGAYFAVTVSPLLLADIYMWAAGFDNGVPANFPPLPARSADVIAMSWGPDGDGLDNIVRDCFDFLTTYGRAGRGCVLCFSIGNNGFIDFTDPLNSYHRAWATYERTLAVGASINVNPTNPIPMSDHADPLGNKVQVPAAVDKRALYSPFGSPALRKPDLVAPSNTAISTSTGVFIGYDPVYSAVRVGRGNVDGCKVAPPCLDYSSDAFGGTSHSAPCVAGAAALMLSARPELSWVQVRDILRYSCVRIDAVPVAASGNWQDLDGDGNPDYSAWYGAGRLDVASAVKLALDAATPLADVIVRDNLADIGNVPSTGGWSESPDIWVRQDGTEAIPALAWATDPPHQNARRGQTNAVFCRVRNRNTATASNVYVRAMIAHWPGLEFVYPRDFEAAPIAAVLPAPLAPGTYLLGEQRIDNLAGGADQIVKFAWPATSIPPETVMLGATTLFWHPCLLLEASPHDGPISGLSIAVRGDNNLAQRNICILNAGDPEPGPLVAIIAGTWHGSGLESLIVDAKRLRGTGSIRMSYAGADAIRELRVGDAPADPRPSSHRPAGEEITIKANDGVTEVPFKFGQGQFALLMVGVGGDRLGDLRITQRRGDGEVCAGYVIRRVAT